MILIVISIDYYNLCCDCDFVNSLENEKYINRKKLRARKNGGGAFKLRFFCM